MSAPPLRVLVNNITKSALMIDHICSWKFHEDQNRITFKMSNGDEVNWYGITFEEMVKIMNTYT